MKKITLGKTGITSPQNAFGALPIQRVDDETAVKLLRMAYEGGMTYFDTARAYSDSEHKVGLAFEGMRDKITIATKTHAKTPAEFWEHLEQSLTELKTDYIDLYQLHCVPQCYKPGDGTGLYECLLEAKEQGKVRHIGITAHLLPVAFEIAVSGLYETLQFPYSYLSGEKEEELVDLCQKNDVGYICMKGLAGGLINRSDVAMAFMDQRDNVLPIWGVQRESELQEWLSYMDKTPVMNEEYRAFIAKEKEELAGDFCRGCGYCKPCTVGIEIENCARMSLMVRRAPTAAWVTPEWQEKMALIENCVDCGLCKERCPYGLDTPNLLRKNLEDYRKVVAGEIVL